MKKRHYFIDIDPLAQPHLTGVGKVVELLAEAMPPRLAIGDDTVDLVYADPLNRRPLQINRDLVAKNTNVKIKLARLMFRKVYGKLLKYRIAPPFNWLMPTTIKYDAAIFPNFASFPMQPKVRSFPVIHDLTFKYFPERVERKNLPYLESVVPQAIRTAASVVTVTEQVKAELMKEYHLHSEQVIVIPLVPRLSPPDVNIIDKWQLELGKYILFVGSIEPRKNLVTLVAAYQLLPQTIRDNYPLVLVGPLGWKNEELIAKLDEAKAKGANIIMPGFVTEPEKAALFSNATTFVLPAVYEGFGIPPMEAMSVGTPVIASDLPVTHEVLGDAGYYMDQNNPHSIADAIAKMVGDSVLRKTHSQRSLARMAQLNKNFEAGCDELAKRMKGDS